MIDSFVQANLPVFRRLGDPAQLQEIITTQPHTKGPTLNVMLASHGHEANKWSYQSIANFTLNNFRLKPLLLSKIATIAKYPEEIHVWGAKTTVPREAPEKSVGILARCAVQHSRPYSEVFTFVGSLCLCFVLHFPYSFRLFIRNPEKPLPHFPNS